MDFSQPKYQFPAGSFQLDITFEFKKSVFFADFAVICLGSGITTTMSSPNITQVHSFVPFQLKQIDCKIYFRLNGAENGVVLFIPSI